MNRGRGKEDLLLYVVPIDANNPYQQCLYNSISQSYSTFKTIGWKRRRWIGIPYFFALSAWARVLGSRVVHVHWPSWAISANLPMKETISRMISLLAIQWLKILRFHIIWTMHNLLPHEKQTDNDLQVALYLARSSSAIIVHTSADVQRLTALGVSESLIHVIPHGNFIDYYGAPPTRHFARGDLGISEQRRTILFFGQIRPYKGVPELLAVWAAQKFGGILLIAGQCANRDLEALIESSAREDSSISAHLHFVREEDVSIYFAAADGVCLPFRSITTSGSALLALSLGVPIVAPRIGTLAELPDEVGYFYGENDETLDRALKRFFAAPESELETRAKLAFAYAKSLSWSSIAQATLSLYIGASQKEGIKHS